MSQNNNLQILPFYDSLNKQNHKKWWTYDKVFGLACELDKLPPFQIQNPLTGNQVSGLILVNYKTGVETDILAKAVAAGLHSISYTDYDLTIYASAILLGIPNISVGYYYLRINYSNQVLYSEVFQMCADVSSLIKLEYWHASDFCYPGGHIQYTYPYKTRVYIPSDIGKPSLVYKEDVIEREGYKFPVQQISYILRKFLMLAPEYLLFALRAARMHDFCTITYGNYVYNVDELLMNIKEWLPQGDLVELIMEFQTDTIVVTNARGFTSLDYAPAAGSCLILDYTALALIVKDSVEYNNFEYNPSNGGAAISLNNGDKILIVDTVAKKIEFFEMTTSPNSYAQQALSVNDTIYNANDNVYYFAPTNETDNVVEPFISSYSNIGSAGLIFGESFENGEVDIWVNFLDVNGNYQEEQRGQGVSSLLLSTGVPFFFDNNILQVQLRVSSAVCPLFSNSGWFNITTPVASGIGTMQIEFDNIIG